MEESDFIRECRSLVLDSHSIGCGQFTFLTYSEETEKSVYPEAKYPFVFVIDGRVDIQFEDYCRVSIGKQYATIIDKTKVKSCICSNDAIILIYSPADRLSAFLKSALNVFNKSFAEPIAFSDSLREWIYNLLKESSEGISDETEFCMRYRKELSKIFAKYSAQELGVLSVPFGACSIKGCESCEKRELHYSGEI